MRTYDSMRWFILSSFFLTGNLTAREIQIFPSEILLDGSQSRQNLLVVEMSEEGRQFGAEVEGSKFTTSDPDIVTIVDGVALARGNGSATISVEKGGKRSSAKVIVENMDRDHQWSFANHVLPVLSKQGCNMGACHGAVAGKGGFRLSLRGYDPPGDFYTITREAKGRRVELGDPARSLLLTKPTMATSHKGNKRLDSRSREYTVIADWISSGATAPAETDATLEQIELIPPVSHLQPGEKTRVLVSAHYSDGRVEDVTDWSKFSSADETVAQVDDDGNVEIIGHGEGAITAWFSSKVKIARIVSPFANEVPDQIYTNAPRQNFIDELVLAQLQQLNLKPSRRTTDAEFVRRVYFDTIGVIPSPEETKSFLADSDPDKRTKLIDKLLQREEFVDYWSYRLSDIFLVNGKLLRPDAVKAYYDWIRQGVASNKPWNVIAEELVTAQGSSVDSGATNFYAVHQDPETMAENVSQAFLGLNIGCAKCHNHPLEKWTNDQYYAFANLFARVKAKGWGGDSRNGDGKRTLFVEPQGDLIQPRTGKPQDPAPLDGEVIDPEEEKDRRYHLADWLTSAENPYFSRSITNRIWAAYFGPGLVDPVDDLRVSNPASNESLLIALSEFLVKSKYDLKKLMRLILESETYQRSSEVLPENKEDRRYLSRYQPRRLMAEVLHDAIVDITETPNAFDNIVLRDGSSQKTEHYKEGTRALQLFDSSVQSYFLKTFGRNEREITCECERSNQPSMVQVLHLSNGDTLNEKLRKEGGVSEQLAKSEKKNSEIIEDAYLRCLSRLPTDIEKRGFEVILESTSEKEKQAAIEDLFWALMTSREFLFQR